MTAADFTSHAEEEARSASPVPESDHRESQHDETQRRESQQEGDVVMPFYIVVDTSSSMSSDIAALTDGLRSLQQLIIDTPAVADVVQVSIIEFDSEARILLPLGSLEEASVPTLTASGGTNYSKSFITLRAAIDADVTRLRAQGYQVFRPCAFFLSDGEPNSSDSAFVQTFRAQFDFDEETKAGNRQYPRFIPFGFRDASLATLSQLAYPAKGGKAFVQKDGARIADAFDAIIPFIGRTMVATGTTGSSGASGAQHVFPDKLDGFSSADSRYPGGVKAS